MRIQHPRFIISDFVDSKSCQCLLSFIKRGFVDPIRIWYPRHGICSMKRDLHFLKSKCGYCGPIAIAGFLRNGNDGNRFIHRYTPVVNPDLIDHRRNLVRDIESKQQPVEAFLRNSLPDLEMHMWPLRATSIPAVPNKITLLKRKLPGRNGKILLPALRAVLLFFYVLLQSRHEIIHVCVQRRQTVGMGNIYRVPKATGLNFHTAHIPFRCRVNGQVLFPLGK